MNTPDFNYVVESTSKMYKQEGLEILKNHGFVVLRNFVPKNVLSDLNKSIDKVLKGPSISGSVGYYMKDANKKIFDGLLLGESSVQIVSNMKVIDFIETYLSCEVLLTEIFMKKDLGNNKIYFPYHCHTGSDLVDIKKQVPFGCGALFYTHDTDEGAFCFSPGTHKLDFPYGDNPHKYPESLRFEILSGMRRVSGLAGDVVIFDERGFHGPEQPVCTERIALLYGYQGKIFSNNTTRNPAPMIPSDLKGLTDKQLDVLGLNSDCRVPYFEYHIRKYDNHGSYNKMKKVLLKMINRKSVKVIIKDIFKKCV